VDGAPVHVSALDAVPPFKSSHSGAGKALAQALSHEVMAMVLAYRSDEDVLQARLGSLLEFRQTEVVGVSAELRNVYARRVARTVAGGVATAAGVAMMLGGAIWALTNRSWFSTSPPHGDGALIGFLLGGAAAAALVYQPAGLLASMKFDRAVSNALSLSGNVRIDLVRVERAQPRRIAADLVERAESWSASLPLVGMALLGPLLLHFLVWIAYTGGGAAFRLSAFDAWIGMTVPIAGLAHLVLAFRAAAYGPRLRAKSTRELQLMPSHYGWMSLVFTAVAGLIPGAILLLVPPILIFFTGLVFIPYSFYRMNRAIVREREVVSEVAE
jgi:hypothetical protein